MKTERMLIIALEELKRAVADKNLLRVRDLLSYIAMLRRERIENLEHENALLRLNNRYRKVSWE